MIIRLYFQGGETTMNEVFANPNRKLELRFRPNALGCKPTCGEPVDNDKSLLLKAKLLQNSKTGETKIVHEVVGRVDTTYNFQGLCDFQFLPMSKNPNGSYKDITKQVDVPSVSVSREELCTNSESTPVFLPPLAFSRTDQPQDYFFRKEVRDKKITLPDHIIGRNREKRSNFNVFVTFNSENVPTKPHDSALKILKNNFVSKENLNKIKAMFEEHPIWLRVELLHKSKVSVKDVKLILPVVAYYYSNGPWRNQWVKLGYDPRIEKGAAIYQTLDYR